MSTAQGQIAALTDIVAAQLLAVDALTQAVASQQVAIEMLTKSVADLLGEETPDTEQPDQPQPQYLDGDE